MRQFSGWLMFLLLMATVINYPNPFNPKGGQVATIACTTDLTTEATLYIYNLAARLQLVRSFNLSGGGANLITWNGYNDYNEMVGNGIYPYQIINRAKTRIARGKIWVLNK